MANRIRRVTSQREFEQVIDDYVTTGTRWSQEVRTMLS